MRCLAFRVLAATVALSLGVPPGWAATVVRPAAKTGGTQAVPTVRPGGLGGLGTLGNNPSLKTAPSLGGSLKALTPAPALSRQGGAASAAALDGEAPASVSAAAAAAPAPAAGRVSVAPAAHPSARAGLRQAAQALGQDAKAGRRAPGLASLGRDFKAPAASDSLGAQRDGIARFFNLKANFGPQNAYDAEDALFEAMDPELAGGSSGRGGGRGAQEPAPYPSYPARLIRYNGKTFPSVAFRPDRPIDPLIVEAINRTEKTLDIALYEFKNREILKALREARKRGVKVRILLDYDHAYPQRRADSDYWPHRSLEIQALLNEGFDIGIIRGLWRYGIQHNKFAVFDGKMGLFGSYNWTYTSERNHYENAVFTTEGKRVQDLARYWEYLSARSVPFAQARDHSWPTEVPDPPADADPSVGYNGVDFPAFLHSPNGKAEDWIIKAIETAKTSISISMFTFRSTRIAEALVAAKKKNPKLKIRVLFDRSQTANEYMKVYADFLAFHRIPVKTIAGPNPDGPEWAEKDHNKFMVVDARLVETGSANWTKNAFLFNYDTAYFLNDKSDGGAFEAFFDDMFGSRMAETVVAPADAPALPSDEELERELRVAPEPPPPLPQWPQLPDPGVARLNGESFPASAVRPQHPIKDLLVKAIDSSEKSIRLALYEFNLPEILEALRRAKKRGVEVQVILDYTHVFPKGVDSGGDERERPAEVQALIDEGFGVTVLRGRRSPGIMHHKFAVFDGKLVEFGSYNWTDKSEENHFESVKFSDEKERVDFYAKVWDWMRGYSVPVDEAEEHPWAKNAPENAPVDADLAIEHNGERFPRQAFSPRGMIEDTLVRAIRAAKTSIDVAMFTFYSARVAEELLRARERNPQLKIRVVLDRMQSKLMKLDDWFAYYDFDVKILAGPNPDGNVYYEKNHNKLMIVDGRFVALGSYNYSGNAEENNYENVNFFADAASGAFYAAYFEMLHATGWKAMKPRRPPADLPTPAEFFNPQRLRAGQEPASLYETAGGLWIDPETRRIYDPESGMPIDLASAEQFFLN